MKIVYIAHPIGGDVKMNVYRITQIVRKINLTMPDVVPFAPYVVDVLAMDDNKSEERDRGIRNDTAILKSGLVDELWVYGEKISAGMQNEMCLAHYLNIPIVLMDPATPVPIHLGVIMSIGYNTDCDENNKG